MENVKFSVMHLEAKSLLALIAKQIYPAGSHALINDKIHNCFSQYDRPNATLIFVVLVYQWD